MSSYVLDTSVAIAWYMDEVFSSAAREWQNRALRGKLTLLIPGLHYWEFANVLRTLVMRKEIAATLALDIYALHLDAPLETHEPDRSVVLETALSYGATSYDAVYIAICLSMDVPLITAERTTTAWVSKLGDRIEHVR